MASSAIYRKRNRLSGPINARYGPSTINLPRDKRADRILAGRGWTTFFCWLALSTFAASEAAAFTFDWSKALHNWEWTPCVYYPWMIYELLYKFSTHHVSPSLSTHVALLWVYVALSLMLTVACTVDRIRRMTRTVERPFDIEGSSHWAIPEEIEKTGLLSTNPRDPGIYIGEWTDPRTGKRRWLRDTKDTHVMLLAPTRSGKGVSIIIPTLLTWTGSLVANDPKGELYEICARARMAMGQYTLKHDPVCTDGSGARFNPIDEIRKGTVYDTKDAMQLALFLVDPLGQGLETGGNDDHWRYVAWDFLTGAILHIVYSPNIRDRTLHGLDAFISSGVSTREEIFEEMLTCEHDPAYRYGWVNERNQLSKTHPIVAAAARAMINRPPTEQGSAMSSAMRYTKLYKDDILAENTSCSDFSIDDIMQNPKGVSLFLINTPEDMIRVRGHMRMVVNMINSRFTGKVTFDWENGARGRQKKSYAQPLLFAQDEFTSTHGKLDSFANALAFHAGYGIRVLIVAQDYAQLEGTYGEAGAQAIISNMHSNVYYATTNEKTAQKIEAKLGTMTYYDEEISRGKGGRTVSEKYKKRPLIYANEFTEMNSEEGIAVIAGSPPIYLTKVRHYNEPAFTHSIARPPAKSDVIPPEDRAMNTRLRALQAANENRIRDRKENATGYAPPNVMPGREEATVTEDNGAGNALLPPYTGPGPFDDSGPLGTLGPPPIPPAIKDRIDSGLDWLAGFRDEEDEVPV
jgi:type IV secretion system protein VirD4